jgi:hypothetical protein
MGFSLIHLTLYQFYWIYIRLYRCIVFINVGRLLLSYIYLSEYVSYSDLIIHHQALMVEWYNTSLPCL